jgi:hypothetical protein
LYIWSIFKKQIKMATYNHITIIEIDEVLTAVSIDFETDSEGNPEILKMTNLDNGDAIAPDLLGETDTDDILRICHEFAANMEADKRREKYQPVNYYGIYPDYEY